MTERLSRRVLFFLIAGWVWLSFGHSVSARQDESSSGEVAPTAIIPWTDTPPQIDGRLDDDAWRSAGVVDRFTQVEPIEGATPSERTEVRLLYHERHLYIAVRCYDSQPEGIVAKQMQRDGELTSDDRISIVLDTFLNRRNGYLFQIGAAGGRRDALLESNRRPNYDWDGIWWGKATIDEAGWSAEFKLPFTTVSFDPHNDRWGFNIERRIRRLNETVRWATPKRTTRVTTIGDAGTLKGFEQIKQGLGLRIKPFLATGLNIGDDRTGRSVWKPGVDVFYNITPAVTAALTINTDFAEAEVDERLVNLTRFPLFFPEKREFFLQDTNVFDFGGIRRNPLPFFSRRIGIVGGEQKNILAGAKVTGREGRLRFGVMDVQMKKDDALGNKNLGVARFSFDVLEESSIGIIATNGDPSQKGDNTLVGADFNFRRTGADGKITVGHLWLQGTHSDPEDDSRENGDSLAFGGLIDYPNEPWRFPLFAMQIGEDFNPVLGFVSRRGRRNYAPLVRYRYRPNNSDGFLRWVDLSTNAIIYTTLDDDPETVDFDFPEVEFVTNAGDSLFIEGNFTQETLFEPFEIIDGVVIPVDTYNTFGVRGELETSPSRPVGGRVELGTRTFFTGTRTDYVAAIELRPNPHLFASLEYELNAIRLDEGSFNVEIVQSRINFLFTPDISWSNTIQWDNRSRLAGINSRLRWEFEPGSEMFIVYNETLDTEDSRLRSLGRELNFKLGWSFQF